MSVVAPVVVCGVTVIAVLLLLGLRVLYWVVVQMTQVISAGRMCLRSFGQNLARSTLIRRDLFIDAPAITYNQQEYLVSLNLIQNSIISYSQGIDSFPFAA
jgi:hypothetical protein